MKLDPLRAQRWALSLIGALFGAGALASAIPGAHPPLTGLLLWNDWAMFAGPVPTAIPVVVGKPRDGGPDVIVVNPVDRTRPFAESLRHARDDKLHEHMGKAITPAAIKHAYLDHVCAEHPGQFERLELRPWTRAGKLGVLIVERRCP
jgi:hypothetical protein